MVVSKYDLQRIRIYKGTSKPDFKPMIEEVAQLYQSGKITKKGTKSGIARAIQMAERLGAERQKTRDVGLRQLEEVKSGERNIAPGKTIKTYFVKGRVSTREYWTHKKSGKQSNEYRESYKIDALRVRATSLADAKKTV